MLKPALSIMLFIFSLTIGFTQKKGDFNWVLPLQKSQKPIGLASASHVAVKGPEGLFLLSAEGQKTALPYDSASYDQGAYWLVWQGDQQGVFHVEKGELLPCIYDYARLAVNTDNSWAFKVRKYGMSAVVNNQNTLVLPYKKNDYAQFALIGDTILSYIQHEVHSSINPDVFYVSKNGQKVPDAVAKKQLPPAFQRISNNQYVLTIYKNGKAKSDTFPAAEQFVDHIAPVKRDTLWGYIKDDGAWLLSPRFQAASAFDMEGMAVVKSKGKYGVIRKDGSYLIEPKFAFLKASIPGYFEYKEGGRIGLINKSGAIALPVNNYSAFFSAGTDAYAAKAGDSLIFFRAIDNSRISVNRVQECSRKVYDDRFIIRQSGQNRTNNYGVLDGRGNWVIPNVVQGSLTEFRHFFVAESVTSPCCQLNGVSFPENKRGRYIIFNRDGAPVVNSLVEKVIDNIEAPYVIYIVDKKYGLAASPAVHYRPDFDELKHIGPGWVAAKRLGEWGVLKWTE